MTSIACIIAHLTDLSLWMTRQHQRRGTAKSTQKVQGAQEKMVFTHLVASGSAGAPLKWEESRGNTDKTPASFLKLPLYFTCQCHILYIWNVLARNCATSEVLMRGIQRCNCWNSPGAKVEVREMRSTAVWRDLVAKLMPLLSSDALQRCYGTKPGTRPLTPVTTPPASLIGSKSLKWAESPPSSIQLKFAIGWWSAAFEYTCLVVDACTSLWGGLLQCYIVCQ